MATTSSTASARQQLSLPLGKGIALELVHIPAGSFQMGSPEAEHGRRDDETQHPVTLTKSFYIGKHLVTQQQWEQVMGSNPSMEKGPDLPVTDVSWDECQEFLGKLNAAHHGGFRMPTEAEWEYACRAGTTTTYAFGNTITRDEANFDGVSITPVGKYPPNAFGLHDMHGNVWEWCNDWYAPSHAGAVTDPQGPAEGETRVLRGGTFFNSDAFVRSANRVNLSPTNRTDIVGFRVAREA